MTAIEASVGAIAPKFTMRQLFGIRNYRLIWSGQVISDFGDSMTRLALLLLINHLTGSITAMATLSIVLAIPRLLFGMLSGVYVDRLNRKHIMVISDIFRGLFVLGFLLADSPEKIWIIYLVGFLQGSISAFFEPARGAMLPNLVPSNGLLAANSISQTSQTIFFMLGSAAAGVMVGAMHTYSMIFFINISTFLLSALLVSQIRFKHIDHNDKSKLSLSMLLQQLKVGIKISFGNRILAGTIVAIGLTMLGIGAINVLMIPLMINDLQIPETWLGAVNIGQTVGMILSGLVIANLPTRFKPTWLTIIGLIGFGLVTTFTAATQNIWQVILVIFVSSIFIPPITASTQTILQVAVPDELRGRTNAARMAIVVTANLISMGMAGFLADQIGTRNVFIISGGFAVLGGIAALIMFRGVTLQPIKAEPAAE